MDTMATGERIMGELMGAIAKLTHNMAGPGVRPFEMTEEEVRSVLSQHALSAYNVR